MTVGDSAFAPGNTPQGGQGDPVGSVSCIGDTIAYHIHAHVSLFVRGKQLAIPRAIGAVDPVMANGFVVGARCLYWLHTHDASGVVHIEPPMQTDLTLGQLFDIWGQPLSTTGVAGYQGTLAVFVNGERYTGDPRAITFASHQQITLQVDTPLVVPPVYIFPDGY
jgi:hypothetical protein